MFPQNLLSSSSFEPKLDPKNICFPIETDQQLLKHSSSISLYYYAEDNSIWYCQRNQKGSPIRHIVQYSVVNTSCSHFKRSLFIERKAKVFTRLVSLQTPVVIHHSERESMTVRRVVWWPYKRPTQKLQFYLRCHATVRRTAADSVRKSVKNDIKSIKVTSQVSSSKIFVYSSPERSNQAGSLVGIASYSQPAWRTSSTQEQFMLASDMAPITIKRLVKWSSEQVFGIDGFNQAIKRAREYGDHRVIQSVTIQS